MNGGGGGDKTYKSKLFGNVAVKVKKKMGTEDFRAGVQENPVPENIWGKKKKKSHGATIIKTYVCSHR